MIDNVQVESILRIVDLAGSEKFSTHMGSEDIGLRIQELTSINSSLSSLGNCI